MFIVRVVEEKRSSFRSAMSLRRIGLIALLKELELSNSAGAINTSAPNGTVGRKQ